MLNLCLCIWYKWLGESMLCTVCVNKNEVNQRKWKGLFSNPQLWSAWEYMEKTEYCWRCIKLATASFDFTHDSAFATNAVTVWETQRKNNICSYVVLGQNDKGLHQGEMKLILIYCLYWCIVFCLLCCGEAGKGVCWVFFYNRFLPYVTVSSVDHSL